MEDRVDHYSNWNRGGVWEGVLDELKALRRKKSGKVKTSSYGIVDSQSVKTVGSSEGRGIDGGKKIQGRKRHIVVDTLGHLIHVMVHAANVHDAKAACDVIGAAHAKCPTLEAFADGAGYRGTAVKFVEETQGGETTDGFPMLRGSSRGGRIARNR